jgi:hypothetical protein
MPPNIMALAVLLVFIIAFLVVLALIDIMAKFVSMILWKLKPKRKKQTRFFILFAFLVLKRREEHVSIKTNAVAFMPAIAGTNGRLHSDFIRLLFLQAHRETDRFFLHLQKFSQRNQTWDLRTSTFAERRS